MTVGQINAFIFLVYFLPHHLLKIKMQKKNIIFDRIQFTENFFGAFASEISKYAKKEST